MRLRHKAVTALIAAVALSFTTWTSAHADLVPPPTDITGSDTTWVPGSLAQPLRDDVAHPGSATEWWYVHLMEPGTARTFIALFFTAPVPVTTMFYYPDNGRKLVLPVVATPTIASTTTPSAVNSAGGITYDRARGEYHFVFHANGYDIDAWLTRATPGVTGGPIRYDGQEMYWTSPVATSHPTGHIRTPDGQVSDLAGWRGYHDHNWGSFNVLDQRYSGWEWGVSHEPDGSATVLGGVVKGNGVFQGVIAHADEENGVIGCMATMRLYDWQVAGAFSYPAYENASCPDGAARKFVPGGLDPTPRPGLNHTFHVTEPFVLDVGLLALPESVGETVPGSIGLIEHIRTLPPRIEG